MTWLSEEPGNLRWSPDGKWIGFTMRVPDAEKWNIDMPAAPEGATWAKTPHYTDGCTRLETKPDLRNAAGAIFFWWQATAARRGR